MGPRATELASERDPLPTIERKRQANSKTQSSKKTPKMEVMSDLARTPPARNDVKPRVKTTVFAMDVCAKQVQKAVKMTSKQMTLSEQEMKIRCSLSVNLKTKGKPEMPPS